MSEISVRDNENNKWKRSAKQQQQQQQKTEKNKWKKSYNEWVRLNDFVVRLS